MSASPAPVAEVAQETPSSPPLSPAPAEATLDQPPSPNQDADGSSASASNLALRSSLAAKPNPTIAKLAVPATTGRIKARTKSNGNTSGIELPVQPAMGITESIASAPAPRPTDFSYDPDAADYEIDVEAALERASRDEDMPGSPTSKIMRAMAPPGASMADTKWPVPPPNASVNLFIGRALLANGNDNWPLKPNDIVNWIRKHYPGEWDGDEGRCSAHRVRTYLARKGADMYYEKLAQSSIAGWRIRQNHLWRFENGGFQGRGMKQEEAILEKAKEHEAAITDRHKAAAMEALAAGHPGVKTSMSLPGTADGSPVTKKARLSRAAAGASGLGPKRRNTKREDVDHILAGLQQQAAAQAIQQQQLLQQQQQEAEQAAETPLEPYYPTTYQPTSSNPSQQHTPIEQEQLDPLLTTASAPGVDGSADHNDHDDIDMNMDMVHQAMQAAAGHIDDLDMGIQLPIEMQMHGEGEHDDRSTGQYYGEAFGAAQGYGMGLGTGGTGQGYWDEGSYGYQEGQ